MEGLAKRAQITSAVRHLVPRIVKHEYEIGALAAIGSRMKNPIGFEVADPELDTPAHIKSAMIDALRTKIDATHYTRIRSLPEFASSVSSYYKKFGVSSNPEDEVLATVGSGEGLYIAFAAIVSPGDEFILPNPTFPNYASLLDLLGGKARFVPLKDDFHLDIDAVSNAISKKTKAIVLCTPNNPTGAVYTRSELSSILKIAKEKNLLVISDENYCEIIYDGKKHETIGSMKGARERVIIANGLSKAFAMTGWRLGYLIANKELIAQLEKLAFEIRGSVNTAVQYAGARALDSGKGWMTKRIRGYERKRNLTVNLLREMGIECHMPEGGFEVFPRVPDRFKGSIEFTKFLANRAQVLVKPGAYFGPSGDRNFRMVYCKPDQTIVEGLRRIRKALRT